MLANISLDIDLTKGVPYEYLKEHYEDFNVNIHLEPEDLMKIFNSYIRTNLDIDLEELNVLTILDIKGQRIVLDVEYLEENDINELTFLMDEFKLYFGRSVFVIRTAMNLSTLFRKMFSSCNNYKFNDDGSVDIVYSLIDITQEEIGQYFKN